MRTVISSVVALILLLQSFAAASAISCHDIHDVGTADHQAWHLQQGSSNDNDNADTTECSSYCSHYVSITVAPLVNGLLGETHITFVVLDTSLIQFFPESLQRPPFSFR